jgi:hypothetical protein
MLHYLHYLSMKKEHGIIRSSHCLCECYTWWFIDGHYQTVYVNVTWCVNKKELGIIRSSNCYVNVTLSALSFNEKRAWHYQIITLFMRMLQMMICWWTLSNCLCKCYMMFSTKKKFGIIRSSNCLRKFYIIFQ